MAADTIIFNICTIVAALYTLDVGADKFIDHTAALALKLGVSPTLVALLTAGAEWEELAVVIAALAQHHPSLAIGNILGSSISNILGAFSLGLIFYPSTSAGEPSFGGVIRFDSSAKIYTVVLFVLTTGICVLGILDVLLTRVTGVVLLVVFAAYVASIAYAIYRGVVRAPELSESESDDDSDSDDEANVASRPERDEAESDLASGIRHGPGANTQDLESQSQSQSPPPPNAHTPLLPPTNPPRYTTTSRATAPSHIRTLRTHLPPLLLSLLLLSLSGYLLAHAASSLASALHLSNTAVGMTVLALATTLPEKLVAVVGGRRGEMGIVVAGTVGSGVFLLAGCVGLVGVVVGGEGWMDVDEQRVGVGVGVERGGKGLWRRGRGGIGWMEVGWLWGSTVVLMGVVFLGGRRWMGVLMLVAYVGFLVGEIMSSGM